MRFHNAPLSLEEILALEIEEFLASDRRWWMLTGQEYYINGETAICSRQPGRWENGRLVPDDSAPNNRLSHSFVRNMVDDKVAYLLMKDHSLRCGDDAYRQAVAKTLGEDFGYTLTRLGFEASNKGIGWLQAYIDEQGVFRMRVVPSEQCVPLWRDDEHTELDGLIHLYERVQYEGRVRSTRVCADYYTAREVTHYVYTGGRLIEDVDTRENPVQPHYVLDGKACGFGKVPFLPFKNNMSELPDLKFVKSLVDEYDKSRSDNANFLEELRRFYWVLKGYGGTDLAEFRHNLNRYGVIRVDDPDEGGVEAISPQIDLDGFACHFEQLKRDILECGQSVNKNIESLGASPSGVALKFLYSSLDLKCNHLETEFRHSFRRLLWFVQSYLAMIGEGVDPVPLDLIFNRDVAINETEAVENCIRSAALLSRRTVLEQHPWIADVGAELARQESEAADAGEEAVE